MTRRADGRQASGPSEAAQGYLLALRATAGDAPTTSAALARRLGVSKQASSEMVNRLAVDGLVSVDHGRDLRLTPEGRAAADRIFRRHALLEWLLIRVVGLGWAESDEEAMRLQGAISPRVEEAVAELVGHPQTCPHGNPMDLETDRRRPAGIPLSEAAPSSDVTVYRITEDAEEDAELLGYLERQQLFPGTVVHVAEVSAARDSIALEGPRGLTTLGLRPASLIRVLPGRADPALFHRLPELARR
jgi:DtxR family transcriptional regulator, Mn-dependent transcriptional regulator